MSASVPGKFIGLLFFGIVKSGTLNFVYIHYLRVECHSWYLSLEGIKPPAE